MKIVINTCFGGFGISRKCAERMAELGSKQAKAELKEKEFYGYGYSKKFPDRYKRDDPTLIQAVEELGREANGVCASLSVVEIPDDVEWEISEYDGAEHIAEKHRTWH